MATQPPSSARWLALASAFFILAGLGMLVMRSQSGSTSAPVDPMEQIQVSLKGHAYTVEVARTHAQRSRGLMYRSSMAPDQGMLFLGQRPQVMKFWMKNTLIPLDILFFDANFRLVDLYENVPPCTADPCPLYPTRVPAQHVLELNAGQARAIGVAKGDVLELPKRP